MNATEAALIRCSRDAHGLVKLSGLWADPRKARNQLSAIIKRGKLTERVTILGGGRGIFAPEEWRANLQGSCSPDIFGEQRTLPQRRQWGRRHPPQGMQ